MDVTCGMMSYNSDSSAMVQLETALLASNWEDVEKYSAKLKKKKDISPCFERVLECYVGIHRQIRLHAATLEMDLTHLLAYQLKGELVKKFVDKLKKIVMDTDGSDLELKLAYVLLGIVKLFSFEGKESLAESLAYFEKIDFDLSKKFLLFEQSDTDITQSSLIEKIFGVLGVYFRGVALELQGHKEDACDQYQIIIDFLRRFKLVQFTRAKSVYDFICAAMYRCGYLLNQVGRAKESAAIFRSFLAFFQVDPLLQKSQPVNSTVRLCKALSIYLDLLDKNFRKFNFKSFCDESGQYQISSHHQNNRDSSIWQAENVQEEIILCSMLLECFGGEVDDGNDAHSQIIKRFSRIGYLEGINRIQKRNFQTHVATIQIYRNLFHAYLSSGKIEQACLAGKMYFSQENSGTDPFTLLSIAKLFLSLPSRIEDAFVILNSRLNCDQLDVGLQVPYFLLRGRYFLLKHQKEQCPFEADLQKKNINLARSSEEFAFVLQVDDRNAEALFNLSLIHCELDDYLNFDEAEKYIKRSLSVDSSQKRAWYLFALIKSARKDFAATLNICNTELSNMVSKDLNLSLLKVSTLLALNRSDEAIEALKRIISAHLRSSNNNDYKMDGGMTVISDGTLGPGNFLSKFLGDLSGSLYEYEGSTTASNDAANEISNIAPFGDYAKMTTFQEYTETFPATLNEYLVGRAIEDSSTPILGSMYAMPIEDLKAIYLNNSGQDLIFRTSRFASTRTTSLLWIEVALVYLNEGLLQDADAALNQAFLTTEVFSAIFAAFGLIEEAKMSLSSAQKFYRKGLSIDFEDEACLLGLARVLMAQNASSGAVFEAETLIRRLLKIDPAIPEAWSILARCCHETGRIVEASSHFERALKKETMAPLRSIRSLNKSF